MLPFLITVDLNIEEVIVDGRDFLYKFFNFLERSLENSNIESKIEILKRVYGDKIELYINQAIKAIENKKPKSRFDFCHSAILDKDIITAHLQNDEVIKGSFGVIFKFAFYKKEPINSNAIKNVKLIDREKTLKLIPTPSITLDNIR